MATVTIQIGNSDNKLTQSEWSDFCSQVQLIVEEEKCTIHFRGYSPGDAPWQNACWVIELFDSNLNILRAMLAGIAKRFKQDSIAFTVGETEFVEALS